jgi:hypothetical protein
VCSLEASAQGYVAALKEVRDRGTGFGSFQRALLGALPESERWRFGSRAAVEPLFQAVQKLSALNPRRAWVFGAPGPLFTALSTAAGSKVQLELASPEASPTPDDAALVFAWHEDFLALHEQDARRCVSDPARRIQAVPGRS